MSGQAGLRRRPRDRWFPEVLAACRFHHSQNRGEFSKGSAGLRASEVGNYLLAGQTTAF
jgi:hypothetical protein